MVKMNKSYVSESDKFLAELAKKYPVPSASQVLEQKKTRFWDHLKQKVKNTWPLWKWF